MAELTNDDLDELERLEREATKGKARVHQFAPDAVAIGKGRLNRACVLHPTSKRNLRQCRSDAEWFAAAVNAFPELIRRAREADELRKMLDNEIGRNIALSAASAIATTKEFHK